MSHLLKNNSFSLAHAACLGLGWGSLGPRLAMENMAERKKISLKGFALANKHSSPEVAYITSNHILSRTN